MQFKFLTHALLLAGLLAGAAAQAGRAPVLSQIDLPHPYYYREMYLPQLTSGPSSLAWSPDSKELIYAMAGSLWRQKLGEGSAQQLTAATAYDYQPDWSADGRWVIYSSYRGDAIELWLLDLQSGATQALTQNRAVNTEPRFSPDGKRIVFTSTLYHKRFHVFTADFDGGKLANIRRLTGEYKSDLPRYYYSPFDHEINPVWTRDGRDIIYVSNRNHIYGTGGFWRTGATPSVVVPGAAASGTALDGGAREFHTEETNWKARPDVSPDGSRLVYSSYLGRAWHNLWLLPAGGGDAFPIAYGDWDMTYPRWSPDGRRIAFISNKSGGTEIDLIEVPGGLVQTLPAPRAPLSASDGAAASQYHGCAGASRLGAGQRHRCGGPVLCAGGRMDPCGRRLRSQPPALRGALFSCAGRSLDRRARRFHHGANRARARAQDRAAAGGRAAPIRRPKSR